MPNLPPGPRLPYWLQTLLVWDRTEWFLKWCRRRYGPAFTVRAFPSKVAVYITEAEDLRAVFAADPEVLGVFYGGSQGRGTMDRYSDLDLHVWVADSVLAEASRRYCRAASWQARARSCRVSAFSTCPA